MLQPTRYADHKDYELKTLETLTKYPVDWGIFTAAVSDYHLKEPAPHKTKSPTLTLHLHRNQKVIEKVRHAYPSLRMVVFKVESNLPHKKLLEQGRTYLTKGYNHIVLNQKNMHKDIRGFFLSKEKPQEVQTLTSTHHLYRVMIQALV